MTWLGRMLRNLREDRLDRKLGLPTRRIASRIASHGFYLGGGIILTRVLGRLVLYLPSRDLSVVPGLLLFGRWEVSTTRTLASLLRPGMIVGDVGANVGYFTAMMADRVGPAGQVHAFEPNPELCGLLRRSVFANGFTEHTVIHEVALGSDDGREMLLCFPAHAVNALGGAAIWPIHDYADSHKVTVRRLDAMAEAAAIELLKIDAEGSEPAIWSGMEGLLRGSTLRTVIIEFSPFHYDDAEGFIASIVYFGFTIQVIDDRLGVRDVSQSWLLAPEQGFKTLMLLLTR